MPVVHATLVQSHPKHPGRPAVHLVGTLHHSPVVEGHSLRVGTFIVATVTTTNLSNNRGKYASRLSVAWAGDSLAEARRVARQKGGSVMGLPTPQDTVYVDV